MLAGGAISRHMIAGAVGVGVIAGLAGATIVATGDAPPRQASDRESFNLVNWSGRAYSIDSFPPDTVLVIYFGYTTCLRACPIALDSIAAAIDGLGAQGALVQPVFIDLDPDRAAQASMPLYMQTFGPSFLGLTGSPEAVARAVAAFKVKVERIQFSADPTDYAMTHVSPIFVMRPQDAHPLSLPTASEPDAIGAALRSALARPPLT